MEWVIAIVFFGLVFDYTNGFHDAANVVSTVIATKVLRPLFAILMATCLNIVGATQVGAVAATLATGLIEGVYATPQLIVAALISAIVWNVATWILAIPSSSSYALVGSLIGATLIASGPSGVIWSGLLFKVILPMLLSPLIGFSIGCFAMKLLKKDSPNFRFYQILSSALVALSHGLNDAQKSMGIITLGLFSLGLIPRETVPFWVILACALTMGLGTASGGFRMIRTMGYKITALTPVQGFGAETSASIVILAASFFGMPISSTHMLAGSIAGVGHSKRRVNWRLASHIGIAMGLTLPCTALLAALLYKLFTVWL